MNKIKKGPLILFGAIFVFLLFMYILGQRDEVRMKKDGIYIIGKVYEVVTTANSSIYRCQFDFHGKNYRTKFSGIGLGFNVGNFVFVKLSHSYPESNKVIYETKVPSCLSDNKNPMEGWQELPLDSCK